MRCSCHVCDTYMVHSEGMELGCVCPECGYRCKACLGTNTVLSREALKGLANDPRYQFGVLGEAEEPKEPERPKHERDEYVD